MSKNEIEQMARDLCNIYNADKGCCFDGSKCTSSCFWYHQATRLYNADYRKMTAKEVIEWECKHIKPQR